MAYESKLIAISIYLALMIVLKSLLIVGDIVMVEQLITITRLPDELCAAYREWLIRGGHEIKIKKDRVIVKKGQKSGEIMAKRGLIQPSYAMNEYMIERFKLFSLQWLKHGKAWIEELDQSMMFKYSQINHQISLAKVA